MRNRSTSLAPLLALIFNASCGGWLTVEVPAQGALVGVAGSGGVGVQAGGVSGGLQAGVNGMPSGSYEGSGGYGASGQLGSSGGAAVQGGALGAGATMAAQGASASFDLQGPQGGNPPAPQTVGALVQAGAQGGGRLRCADPVGVECANALVQGSVQLGMAASSADGVVHCRPHQVTLAGSNERLEDGDLELAGIDPSLGAQIESGSLQMEGQAGAQGAQGNQGAQAAQGNQGGPQPRAANGRRRAVAGGTLQLRTQDGRLLEAEVVEGELEADGESSGPQTARADLELNAEANAQAGANAHPQQGRGAPRGRPQGAQGRRPPAGAQQRPDSQHGAGQGAANAMETHGAGEQGAGEEGGAGAQSAGGGTLQAGLEAGTVSPQGRGTPGRRGHLRIRLRVPTEVALAARAGARATAAAQASSPGGARRRAITPRERAVLSRVAQGAGAQSAGTRALVDRLLQDGIGEGQAMFYNIPIVGHSLAVVVDVSYSMTEDDPGASVPGGARVSKLDNLRTQLALLLASLPQGTTVNLVAFSSNVNALWPDTRTLDEHNLEEAMNWVAQLRPLDETRPLQAVERANSMQAEQVILLTDGRPTYADTEEPALLQLAERIASRNARLDVVGIGPDQNAPYLDRLAERGRGVAVHL